MQTQLGLLLGLAVLAFLYLARSLILPIVVAYVVAMVLQPFVSQLSRWRVPRVLGALLVLGALFGAVSVGFVHLSQPTMSWINDAPQNFARLRQRFDQFYPAEKFQKAIDAADQIGTGKDATNRIVPVTVTENHHMAGEALTWTGGILGDTVETVVLLYLFLILGDEYLGKILDGSDSPEERHRILKLLRAVQETISRYLLTVTCINLTLGLAVAGGLFFLGVPNAAVWGLLAWLLNYIPYFGPIIGIIIVGLVSLLTGTSFPHEILPPLWYLLLHVTEADFITPLLLGRHFTISPLAIFISLLFWIWLWGPLGALLSMPLLLSLKVVCREFQGLAAVARFL